MYLRHSFLRNEFLLEKKKKTILSIFVANVNIAASLLALDPILEIKLEMDVRRDHVTSYTSYTHTNVQFLFADALVRSDLVEQIPNVVIICQEAPHLFGDVLRNHLLDIVIKYLSDLDNQASDRSTLYCVLNGTTFSFFSKQNPKTSVSDVNIRRDVFAPQVRQMAQSALTTLGKLGFLDNDAIENVICPTIESLSYMMVDEHIRNANISVSFPRFIRFLPILPYCESERYYN